MGKTRFEVVTSGFDESLQTVFGDPYGGTSNVGLRVPTLATPSGAESYVNRYLFNLASFSVGEGARGRILGWRQLVTLGYRYSSGTGAAPYTVELPVASPIWRFPDGNISWHLQRLGPPSEAGIALPSPGPNDQRSLKYKWCETPALLYQAVTLPALNPQYVDLTAYTPPNSGRPWGTPLQNGQQGTFYDLRANWRDDQAWFSLDIPFEGPDIVALFASVKQTNPSTRPTLALPGTVYQNGLGPEDLFLQNYPNAIYWRVAGSLIVETE